MFDYRRVTRNNYVVICNLIQIVSSCFGLNNQIIVFKHLEENYEIH